MVVKKKKDGPENGQEKKNLEETIKEKVSPLLEETMQKSFGITISKIEEDISDKLAHPQLDVYIPLDLGFSEAKKTFKKEFLKKELRLNKGNISRLAKHLGLDRRSVHRVIKDLGIEMEELRGEDFSKEKYRQDAIGETIKSTLDQYKEIIQPQKMEKMYQEVSALSRNIAKFIPLQELNWKQAEREFEKQFLVHALEKNNWNISKTAADIGIRVETLHRKVKRLGLKGL